MELLWIFLLIFHGCAGNTDRRECVVFNIPLIMCAPDVSKVSIMPYVEYSSIPHYRDLLSKHSCKSLYDLLCQGVPVKLECCEPKPLDPPANQTLPQNNTDTYTPVPLADRRTTLDECGPKTDENTPPTNGTKNKCKGGTEPEYTVVDDYSTYRIPEKEHPLTALVEKSPDCSSSKDPPPYVSPASQCKGQTSTEDEGPVLQNAPTSRFIPADSERPVCANPRYVAQLSTLHSRQPHNARTYDQNCFHEDEHDRFIPEYSNYQNHPHPQYMPSNNKHQGIPRFDAPADRGEVSPTPNSSRDYCVPYPLPKPEPKHNCNQDHYPHSMYPNKNQHSQNVYPHYGPYSNHHHQRTNCNEYNPSFHPGNTCPIRDQHSGNSYSKEKPPQRSSHSQNQKPISTTADNGQRPDSQGSDKQNNKPPKYSKVNILSCDREIKPPTPPTTKSPDTPDTDPSSEPNNTSAQPRPFDIDFTHEDYTGSSIVRGADGNNGDGEVADYQDGDNMRSPESDGGGPRE